MEKKLAKSLLAAEGIKVFQKDIKNITVHHLNTVEHEVGEGIAPDYFSHREVILVEMNDGKMYEILRETVDKDGEFSINSAKFATREVRLHE